MKRILAIALLTVGTLALTKAVSAQRPEQGHYETVQYGTPPVPVLAVCEINGTGYQVDYDYRIWDVNASGRWLVIGRIVVTPDGLIATRLDGARSRAICQ